MVDTLFIIPARGGSKGIPHKNSRLFMGKPLVQYALEQARHFADDADICLSTDDISIKTIAEKIKLEVPFLRPAPLSNDEAGSYEVILHALAHYQNKGKVYSRVVLLQPTSPFRKVQHIQAAVDMYDDKLEMVVSVKETAENPYYNLFEEDKSGFLHLSKNAAFVRRQDAPTCYAYNGAVYVINVAALHTHASFAQFTRIKKTVMDELSSIDLDTPLDWAFAEYLKSNNFVA